MSWKPKRSQLEADTGIIKQGCGLVGTESVPWSWHKVPKATSSAW